VRFNPCLGVSTDNAPLKPRRLRTNSILQKNKVIHHLFDRSPIETLAFGSVCVLVLAWCVASLWFPFGWDHGIMASVGDVIVRGGMPYQDAWDMKGPLAYCVFALAQWIFGQHMWAIRLLDVLLLLIACATLTRMMARITSLRAGLWTSAAFALSYASLTWFYVSQPDGWVALFMVIGVGLFITTSNTIKFYALGACGLLIGCCALIKPIYSAFVLVPVVFVLSAQQPVSRRVSAAAIVGVNAIIPPLLAFVWFAYRGALDSLIEVHLAYAASSYSGISSLRPGTVVQQIFDYLWTGGPELPSGKVAVVLPAIAFGAYSLWRESRQLALTFATWLGIALFCVALQGRYWTYHWIPTFPPFAVLGAFGLCKLVSSGSDRTTSARVFALIAAALFLTQVMVTPVLDVKEWLLFISGSKTHTEYYEDFKEWEYVAGDNMAAARYIRDRSSDSDGVAVWGNDATVRFLSGRPDPTRFVYAMPLTQEASGSFRATYRREYISDLSEKPPLYLVVGLPYASTDKAAMLDGFPELLEFLQDQYQLERQIGFLDLYRRIE